MALFCGTGFFMKTAKIYQHRWALIRVPILAMLIVLGTLAWWQLYPMPPRHVVISGGMPDGAYEAHAARYAEAFGRHGMRAKTLGSPGSPVNLQRLGHGQADLALVQGGMAWTPDGSPTLPPGKAPVQTIAIVDTEGLWLFSRHTHIRSLTELSGRRVAAGPIDSGHRHLLQRLLRHQRVADSDVQWSSLSGLEAARALERNALDAVFLVASPHAPVVMHLLRTPGVHLARIEGASAIIEHHPFLDARLLPQDSLGKGLPALDTPLLTTSTHLLARGGLDPAVQRLAAAITREVHGGPQVFHHDGELPNLRHTDFPPSPQARQVLLRGLSGPEAWMPFVPAQWLQRLVVIGLPLSLLGIGLMHLIPAFLHWRLVARLSSWYGELKFIEHDLLVRRVVDVGGMELSRINARLEAIMAATARMRLPPELQPRWYTLRQHIAFVRSQLERYRGR